MEKGDIALIYVKDKTSASGENVFLKAGSRYQGMSFKRLAPKGEKLTA